MSETTSVILSISHIFAVILIPIILWQFQKKYQDRKQKKDAMLKLFLTLMANRNMTHTKEWASALNTIDVVFYEDRKVRESWRSYFNALDKNSQHYNHRNSYLLDLLSNISYSVGYGNLRQTDIDWTFLPQAIVSDLRLKDLYLRHQTRVLMNSKSVSESIPDDKIDFEYNQMMKKLELSDCIWHPKFQNDQEFQNT